MDNFVNVSNDFTISGVWIFDANYKIDLTLVKKYLGLIYEASHKYKLDGVKLCQYKIKEITFEISLIWTMYGVFNYGICIF